MRSARTMAKRVMQIAREEFGLQPEKPEDLMSSPRTGDAFKMEYALRLVMMEEELRFRRTYPQLMQMDGMNINRHEYIGKWPTTEGLDKTSEV
jgi:hypothetical protein